MLSQVSDPQEIYRFYLNSGRRIPLKKIRAWNSRGYQCWIVLSGEQTVAATWVWVDRCRLPAHSGRSFSRSKTIIFDHSIGYVCYTQVHPGYRGKGYGTSILHGVSHELGKRGIKALVVTMAMANQANRKCWINAGGNVIGIIKTIFILGIPFRKEVFLEPAEVCWK